MAFPNLLGIQQDMFNNGQNLSITDPVYFLDLDPNTILATNSANELISSTTSTTQLTYINNVTSDIQSQINSANTNISTNTSSINTINTTLANKQNALSGLTIGDHIIATASNNIGNSSVLSESGSVLTTKGNIVPNATNTINLGSSTLLYNNIYATNVNYSNLVSMSDKTLKRKIKDADIGLDFINSLQPKSFRYISDGAEKKRYGLIAQDVVNLLVSSNMYNTDLVHTVNDKFALNYVELITPLIKAIQELSAKVDELTEQLENIVS